MSWTTVKVIELNVPSNRTGRVYTEAVMQQAINMLPTDVTLFAACQKETSSYVKLDSITHLVENLRIENNWLVADIKELDTPLMRSFKESGNTTFKFFLVGHGNIHDSNIITNYTIVYIRSEPQW